MILAPPSGRRPGADVPPCPPLATPLVHTVIHVYLILIQCTCTSTASLSCSVLYNRDIIRKFTEHCSSWNAVYTQNTLYRLL